MEKLVIFMVILVFVSDVSGEVLRGDINGDGSVDFADFLILASEFGKTGEVTGTDTLRVTVYDTIRVQAPDTVEVIRTIYILADGEVSIADTIFQTPSNAQITEILPGGVEMKMIWVDPGEFVMGTTEEQRTLMIDNGLWESFFANEMPAHRVGITRGFYLGKYEVTQSQWESVMGTTPWFDRDAIDPLPQGADFPAVNISWDDAQAFIQRLNETVGDSLYRLPTEAEWEYACKAGTQTLWFFGDSETNLTKYAWFEDNARDSNKYQEVGKVLPNPWGFYNMLGNVTELVQDGVEADYYSNSPFNDPMGPRISFTKRLRGGNFLRDANRCRPARRSEVVPYAGVFYTGFRVVRIIKED